MESERAAAKSGLTATTTPPASDSPSRRTSKSSHALSSLRGRFEFGDALLFVYALAFARQYFWGLDNNALAWALSAPLAAAACYFYVRTKPFASESAGREFWLVVALPLLLVYAFRAPFPDVSFDVLNYRLLHAERSLRGTLYAPGDFFPTPAPYDPAPDTITGLFRLALGYRLGTIVNLLALVWAARVADKILRPVVARAWARAACVLLAALAEHLLFEVNNYMVDLLAVPLLLEATHLALRSDGAEDSRGVYVHAALLLGACAALKLTNVVMVVPLVLVFAHKALFGARRLPPRLLLTTLASCFVAFVAPLLPFAVYLWRLTGNPLFPLANSFFKSPYWPTGGGWDARWGPTNFRETLAWPVLAFFQPERHSELAVYSGRLSVGFVVALAGLLLCRRDARVRTLCLLVVAGCLIWSAAGMGYSRYGLHLEMLSGVGVVAVACALVRGPWRDAASWRRAAAALCVAALVAQAAAACVYAYGYEWSMRHNVLHFREYRKEARQLLRDRSLTSYLTEEERARYAGVGAWVVSGWKSAGLEIMLNESAPAIAVNYQEFLTTRESKRRFVRAFEEAPPGRVYSLVFPEDLSQAREFIRSRGLEIASEEAVEVPLFSPTHRLGMMLLRVAAPAGAEARAKFESSWMSAAFPESDYRAGLEWAAAPPASMRAGERATLTLRVRNDGRSVWPARGDTRGMFQVNAGDRWLDAEAARVVNDLDGRRALESDLAPGAFVGLKLDVTAPKEPGEYTLEVDMIHEGVTFFREKGSTPLRARVRVGP
ncbi:MAG TPA: hypothetical protein VM936_07640 [Pyrinomonadaceae bacterium]|nr:hypothetical protein [Pyrinomonadaceae bacterium]